MYQHVCVCVSVGMEINWPSRARTPKRAMSPPTWMVISEVGWHPTWRCFWFDKLSRARNRTRVVVSQISNKLFITSPKRFAEVMRYLIVEQILCIPLEVAAKGVLESVQHVCGASMV